jgi:hypothetical protein
MILRWDGSTGQVRWLLVECKSSKSGVIDAARKAVNDLLAYRRAFSSLLDAQPEPYGLGLAWGRELEAHTGSEIMLATADTLYSAMVATVD